jgi:hypothetical protein
MPCPPHSSPLLPPPPPAHRFVFANNTILGLAGTGTAGFSGDGGPAAAAQLSSPTGIAIDANERFVYISETGNKRIRQVSMADRVITTLSGIGTGRFAGDGGPASGAILFSPRHVDAEQHNTRGTLISDTGEVAAAGRLKAGTTAPPPPPGLRCR